MNLAPAYDQWLEETLKQGREESQVAIAQRMLQNIWHWLILPT